MATTAAAGSNRKKNKNEKVEKKDAAQWPTQLQCRQKQKLNPLGNLYRKATKTGDSRRMNPFKIAGRANWKPKLQLHLQLQAPSLAQTQTRIRIRIEKVQHQRKLKFIFKPFFSAECAGGTVGCITNGNGMKSESSWRCWFTLLCVFFLEALSH